MNHLLLTPNWSEYSLIDSGEGEKLEQFGPYIFVRSEPKALWNKSHPEMWQSADAVYVQSPFQKEGRWNMKRPIKTDWILKWNNISFKVRPTSFKHMGVFPENVAHWEWIQRQIELSKRKLNILNLFAYTGGATLAALASGTAVTHVDASKSTVTWAHENATLSGLDGHPVRWIVDDALTFVKREVKRGKKYDGIIMDPPKFGRAENGKIWKFEEHTKILLEACRDVLSLDPVFCLVNAYTVEYSPITLVNMLSQLMPKGTVEHGEIVLQGKNDSLPLPTSMFARWSSITD